MIWISVTILKKIMSLKSVTEAAKQSAPSENTNISITVGDETAASSRSNSGLEFIFASTPAATVLQAVTDEPAVTKDTAAPQAQALSDGSVPAKDGPAAAEHTTAPEAVTNGLAMANDGIAAAEYGPAATTCKPSYVLHALTDEPTAGENAMFSLTVADSSATLVECDTTIQTQDAAYQGGRVPETVSLESEYNDRFRRYQKMERLLKLQDELFRIQLEMSKIDFNDNDGDDKADDEDIKPETTEDRDQIQQVTSGDSVDNTTSKIASAESVSLYTCTEMQSESSDAQDPEVCQGQSPAATQDASALGVITDGGSALVQGEDAQDVGSKLVSAQEKHHIGLVLAQSQGVKDVELPVNGGRTVIQESISVDSVRDEPNIIEQPEGDEAQLIADLLGEKQNANRIPELEKSGRLVKTLTTDSNAFIEAERKNKPATEDFISTASVKQTNSLSSDNLSGSSGNTENTMLLTNILMSCSSVDTSSNDAVSTNENASTTQTRTPDIEDAEMTYISFDPLKPTTLVQETDMSERDSSQNGSLAATAASFNTSVEHSTLEINGKQNIIPIASKRSVAELFAAELAEAETLKMAVAAATMMPPCTASINGLNPETKSLNDDAEGSSFTSSKPTVTALLATRLTEAESLKAVVAAATSLNENVSAEASAVDNNQVVKPANRGQNFALMLKLQLEISRMQLQVSKLQDCLRAVNVALSNVMDDACE